jgi:4-amino-4-deoxy-L-arabinose transferase-like glycosyltransferase
MVMKKNSWTSHPLFYPILLGLLFRIIAAVFSRGFAFFDDHFIVIETARWWTHVPFLQGAAETGHRFFYLLPHYLLFKIFSGIRLTDPQIQMFVVRLIHALFSAVSIILGYFIARELGGEKTARKAAWVIALLWIFPFLSVRNLAEFVSTPFILLGSLFAVQAERSEKPSKWLLAVLAFGLAFLFRIQTSVFVAGMILTLICMRKWKSAEIMTMGYFIVLMGTFGLVDWMLHGNPFSSFIHTSIVNLTHYNLYPRGNYFVYAGVILAAFIPPVSFLYGYGFFRSWKNYAVLFWGIMAFFIFHSIFPAREERLILPIVPLVGVLAVVGWDETMKQSRYWPRHPKLLKNLHIWFWAVNLILLLLVSTTYTKRARVETLTYLSKKNDVQAIIMERNRKGVPSPPVFYLNKDVPIYTVPKSCGFIEIKQQIDSLKEIQPNYLVLYEDNNIETRVREFESAFNCTTQYAATIQPTIIDNLLYFLNPHYNINQAALIYQCLFKK